MTKETDDGLEQESLGYLMILKCERCGKVEGRGHADERKQCRYISQEEASAPTVSTKEVFLTALIDTCKQCMLQWWIPQAHSCKPRWIRMCLCELMGRWPNFYMKLMMICRNTPINSQTKHGQTRIRHITCLGFCRVENPNPNRLELLRSLFGRKII